MEKYIIHGGVRLEGSVKISGSKNAALPIFAATLLTDEEVILKNVPQLSDTQTMTLLLRSLGKKVSWDTGSPGRVIIQPELKAGLVVNTKASYEIVKRMRASICVLGPLLTRYSKAEVSLPGGCAFGPRPVDLHISGLRALGADVKLIHGNIVAEAKGLLKNSATGLRRLRGGHVPVMQGRISSVLATDNILSAAVLAEGETCIENAAREPETEDLVNFLKHIGAEITQEIEDPHKEDLFHEGKSISIQRLRVKGVSKLHGGEYTIIPDRIEAGSFMSFAAITGGKLLIQNCEPKHLHAVIQIFEELGLSIQQKSSNELLVKTAGKRLKRLKRLKGIEVSTGPYPLFPTDMQALLMAVAVLAEGDTILEESIYSSRFNHVGELERLGASITLEGNKAYIHGVSALEGARVMASDLRAGAALVAASLAASGKSELRRVYHIKRGYENLLGKLKKLGAKIVLEDG